MDFNPQNPYLATPLAKHLEIVEANMESVMMVPPVSGWQTAKWMELFVLVREADGSLYW